MTKGSHNVDVFDSAYRDRVRDSVYKTIVEVSIDPKTNVAALGNHETYDALIWIQAMFLATSKEASSPTKIRELSEQFAKKLRVKIPEFKAAMEKQGSPFDSVIHTDELQ
jgi:hypothetical protein